MWYALAVWFMTTPPTAVPIVNIQFETKSECVAYITEHSNYDKVLLDMHHIIILDDGVQDMFGVACQTRTQET